MATTEADIRALLGNKVESFTKNGIFFLKCRYNGTEQALTKKLIEAVREESLQIPKEGMAQMTDFLGYTPQLPAVIIFLLGRIPSKAREGDKFGAGSRSLNPEQEALADELVKSLTNVDHRYQNRRQVLTDKSETVAQPQTEKKPIEAPSPVAAKKTATKKAQPRQRTRKKVPEKPAA